VYYLPNNYFQFKQFTVQQDNCAMKVCTDACLFGAYIAGEIQDKPLKKILDIGTGTGLLPLMLAQKNKAVIDTVEIDNAAYEQAKANLAATPWATQINIFNTDIADFNNSSKYDCIISNPPFFEADLQSDDKQKNAAKHDTSLTLQQLLNNVDKLLNSEGLFTVLLPYHRTEYFINLARTVKLNCYKKVLVKQTPKHDYFRSMLIFSKQSADTKQEEIIIKNEQGIYSDEFISLLKDYYLYL
jgi:tRNA1Val (adenine37-N6)-methyltransferase